MKDGTHAIMICTHCCHPVKSLYVAYSNNHIKLTDCPSCQNVVDSYVEYDNVLLFIDLLLLKPEAYRHLVFNSLESQLSKYPKWKVNEKGAGFLGRLKLFVSNLRNWLLKFDRLNRIWILTIAFEVYLVWASEERKYQTYYSHYSVNTNLLMNDVLQKDALSQYTYFAIYSIIDISLLHNVTQYLLIHWLDWGTSNDYAKDVISYTILLSYGAKIFPILMLIWPYDTLLSTSIIQWVANLYIIEALKIVTNRGYFQILQVFVLVSLVRFVCVKPLLSLIVSNGDLSLAYEYLRGECKMSIHKIIANKHFFL